MPITKAKIMDAVSLQFPDESFDTVVQTMGLCSTNDPIRSLKEMQRFQSLSHFLKSYKGLQKRWENITDRTWTEFQLFIWVDEFIFKFICR